MLKCGNKRKRFSRGGAGGELEVICYGLLGKRKSLSTKFETKRLNREGGGRVE